MSKPKTVLIFNTYIDEISLTAGGLIANHSAAGDRVIVTILCGGPPSSCVYPEVDRRYPETRWGRFKTKENYNNTVIKKEIEDSKRILGIEEVINWGYNACGDELFDSELIDRCTALINQYEPDIVITHWPVGDYTDFIGAGTMVMRSLIRKRVNKMPQVYFAETLTGRHAHCFAPSVYVDISDTIALKKQACEAIWEGKNLDYFFYPFAMPIAQFRGRECGVAFAEALVPWYGALGIEKQPNGHAVGGAHPMTMTSTVKCLDRKEFKPGVHPSYGKVDPVKAAEIYGV